MKVAVYSGKMDGVFDVKGDYFLGANLTASNVIGNRIRIVGFDPTEKRGCDSIKELMLAFRAKGTTLNIEENVSFLPMLLITATFACSETQIKMNKECLKNNAEFILKATEGIGTLGGEAKITDYGVLVKGRSLLKGGAEVDASEDLRLALAYILAGTVSEEKIVINNVGIVDVIYPNLIEQMKSLGLNVEKV